MNSERIFKESIRIKRLLDKNIDIEIIYRRWRSLKNRMFRGEYLSRVQCAHIYCIDGRVGEIKDREDLTNLILYYSDRWHPSRVRTFDEAFNKIKNGA